MPKDADTPDPEPSRAPAAGADGTRRYGVGLAVVIAGAIALLSIAATINVAIMMHKIYANRLDANFEQHAAGLAREADLTLQTATIAAERALVEVAQDPDLASAARKGDIGAMRAALAEHQRAHRGEPRRTTFVVLMSLNAISAAGLTPIEASALDAFLAGRAEADQIHAAPGLGGALITPPLEIAAGGQVLALIDLPAHLAFESEGETARELWLVTEAGMQTSAGAPRSAYALEAGCRPGSVTTCEIEGDAGGGLMVQLRRFPNAFLFVNGLQMRNAQNESVLATAATISLASIFSIAFAIVLATWITAPLQKLLRAAQRVAGGKADPSALRERFWLSELTTFSNTLFSAFAALEKAGTMKRYRRLFDELGEALLVVDRHWRVREANTVASELLGVHRDQLIGGSLRQRVSPTHFDSVSAAIDTVIDGGKESKLTASWARSHGGPERLTELHFRPIDYEGAPAALVMGIDLTRRRAAEIDRELIRKRLHALLENMPAAIAIKDRSGRYIVANRDWQEWFGSETVSLTASQELRTLEAGILSRGATVDTETERAPNAPGPNHLRTLRFPIRDYSGGVTAIGEIHMDIGHQKTAERELRRAVLESDFANRAKSSFLANMSHELRTPLNAIIGFSDILRREMMGPIDNKNYVEYAEDVYTSAQHLLTIINGILDLSKIEAGKHELREDTFGLDTLLAEAVKMIAARNSDRRLRFHAGEAPLLHADRSKIKQVVLNLLSNAVKFSEPDTPIDIEVDFDPEAGYAIRVIDRGIGIPADKIGVAMSPFGQVDGSFARKYDGAGLGLPLCAALLDMHGGELELDSVDGEGTTAIVRLPAERARPGYGLAVTS